MLYLNIQRTIKFRGMNRKKLREVERLRSIDNGLQSVHVGHRLGRSLNDFFNAIGINITTGYDDRIDLDRAWTDIGLSLLPGYINTAFYTRRCFMYPHLSTAIRGLPIPTPGKMFWIGVGDRVQRMPGIACLYMDEEMGYRLMVGTNDSFVLPYVQAILPADFATMTHFYEFKLNKSNFEFYVNGILRGVVLFGVYDPIPTWENNFPYVLASCRSTIAPELTAFVENWDPIDRTQVIQLYPRQNPIKLYPNNFVVSSGDPLPPGQYPLFTENTPTMWRNGTLSGLENTSHPVPVWGYTTKTLLFQSGAGGMLRIEIFAGGAWREYQTRTLTADKLEVIALTAEMPLVRCIYDAVATDVIAVAEILLS